MKKILLTAFLFVAFISTQAQTTVFRETFELPSEADSVTSTGTPAWTINTALSAEGAQSYTAPVGTATTTYLETDAFNTVGNTFIKLQFSHIAKIEFFDSGTIEVSNDNGATWTQLTCPEYLGQGTFCQSGNKFASNTYLQWDPANPTAQPQNSWWKSEEFDISAFAANSTQVKVRFALTDGNNSGASGNFGWLIDDIRVVMAPCELIPPVITLNAPIFQGTAYIVGPFNISATVSDASGIDSTVIAYNVNGGVFDTITMTAGAGGLYTGVIPGQAVGDSVCYQVVAWDSSACGNIAENPNSGFNCFVISNAPPPNCVGTPVTAFPWSWDFESFTSGTATFGAGVWGTICCDWTRNPAASTSSGYGWCVRNTNTPSFGTGPDNDNTSGSGNFMYTEVPFGSNGQNANLTSPCLDLFGMIAPELEFYYHMAGTGCGTLLVQVNNGVQWNDVFTISGQQQSSTSAPWTKVNVPLSLFAGNTIQVRFRTTATTSTAGDIAIDDVTVFEKQPVDGAIIAVLTPPLESCGFTSNETVTVRVFNAGLAAQDTLPVAYRVGQSGTIVRDTIFQNLLPGDTLTHVFSQGADLSVGGTLYNIQPWTEWIGEQAIGNDTLQGYNVFNSLTAPPYVQDFENFIPFQQNSIEGWVQDLTDDDDWTFQSGGTTSAATGPQADHTTGTASGVYAYMEVSQISNGEVINLISPCLDFNLAPTPKVEFWYHMFGTQIGTLNLDVQNNAGLWVNAWSLSGNQGDQWVKQTVDLTAYAFQSVKIRFRAQSLGCCAGDISIDDIYIYQPQPNDVGVVSIISPLQEGCNLTASENVTVAVTNFGTATQDTIPVSYQLDNGSILTDTLFTTLNPGDTVQFTFSSTIDLSTGGQTYVLGSWTDLAAEQTFLNDSTLGYSIINTTVATPMIQDFELFNVGIIPAQNWEVDGTLDEEWTFTTGSTGTPLTGPTADHTLGTALGKYAYIEANTVNNGEVAGLISPCIDMRTLVAPKISFYYHMWGAGIGTLSLDIQDSTGTWVNVWNKSGDQGNAWIQGLVDATPYAGKITKIRFRGVTLAGFNSAGDMAIDDIGVFEPQPNDVALAGFDSPSSEGCDLSNAQPVTVQITNLGLNVQTSIPVTVTVPGQTALTGTWTGTLNPGDTVLYTLPGTIDLSNPGATYSLTAYTALGADQNLANDTVSGYQVSNTLFLIPYVEPFTTFTAGGGNVGAPGVLDNFWTRSSSGGASGFNWLVQTGPTSSFATGPNGDHTTGSSIYMYTESSSGSSGQVAILESPCLDLNWYSARVDFYTHRFGTNMGSLFLDIQDSTGAWTNIWSITGSQQTSETAPWSFQSVDLAAYVGQNVRIRFRAISLGCCAGDMAIDDINVYPVFPSAATNEINVSPSNFFILPQASPVSAVLENSGSIDLDHFKVTLEIDNQVVVTDSLFFTVPLGPGQSTTHTFSQIWQADPGAHTICVYTSEPNLINDGFTGDDTLCYIATVFDSTSSFPYCNNFDGGLDPLVALNYVTYEPGGNQWEAGTPNQTVISGANSAPNAWMTGISTDYMPRDSSALFSPVFNVNADSCYKISFYHAYRTENNQDGGAVEYSQDGGATWTSIGSPGSNWYNTQYVIGLSNTSPGVPGWTGTSNGWEYAERTVKFPAAGAAIIRWRFGADFSVQSEGWAIDDLCIENIGACTPTSIEEIGNIALRLSPNPASSNLLLTLFELDGEIDVEVINVLGEIVNSFSVNPMGSTTEHNLDVRELSNGVYYLTVRKGNHVQTERFVIAR